ncbi:MAG: Nif3-like dinuclear metal center hexameric protein [Deltaproteobacteria bacterium]|nr:Nif3-like dinuclear metal center hexameric protein [Deltaproteobacteria bacterium]
MAPPVKNIISFLNKEAPFSLAESWDNVGLLIGNPEQEITSILIGLDPTNSLIDEALVLGANTVITHHPVIFRPIPAINTANPEGKLLEKALVNKIAIIACHTNLDSAADGVSDILGSLLGLTGLTPLLPANKEKPAETTGLGRIGSFSTPVATGDFIQQVMEALNLRSLQVAGKIPEMITTVAVCGGSGSDLATEAFARKADIYLSAEIKHDTAIWAGENNFCVIDATHFATEQPSVGLLAEKLKRAADREKWNITIRQSESEHHPFTQIDRNYSTRV